MDIASTIEEVFIEGTDQDGPYLYTQKVTVFEDTIYGSPIENTYYAQPADYRDERNQQLYDIYDDGGHKVADDVILADLASASEEAYGGFRRGIQEDISWWA